MSSTPFVVCLIETNTGVDVIQANSLKGARLLMSKRLQNAYILGWI